MFFILPSLKIWVQRLAALYFDRARINFITTSSSLGSGDPIRRNRIRQIAETSTNLPPARIQRNSPTLSSKFETKKWVVRMNLSIFGIIDYSG